MKFRPCIDIHNGKVKQIVGGSLSDHQNQVDENFVSEKDGAYYANLYKKHQILGGHIILLNPSSSAYYTETKKQAMLALKSYPNGLQIGGGITAHNAKEYLDAGATHVIVTSYVFKDGKISFENLITLVNAVGKEHLVLDLSCRKKDNQYYIVTDRWQNYTDVVLNRETLDLLSEYCDEFLVHAVDVEGKANGIEADVVKILGDWNKIPITYAGGVRSFDDLRGLKVLGKNKIDVTIGSALDLFGGSMEFEKVIEFLEE